jgi:hypothetical protein
MRSPPQLCDGDNDVPQLLPRLGVPVSLTGRRVAPSDALPATHPAVAAQWHPTKNGTQTAAEVSYGSDHYAWWQCDRYRTHVWRARINSRTGIIASGCRHCAELRGKGGRPPSPIRVPVAA